MAALPSHALVTQVMKGYLNNPTATASTLKRDVNGAVWLHTGDIAWRDADGQTRIVDRAKELIKCKGFQVRGEQGGQGGVRCCCVLLRSHAHTLAAHPHSHIT